MGDETLKRCGKCGIELPATLENFKKGQSGNPRSPCLACHRQQSREYGNLHAEARKRRCSAWYRANKARNYANGAAWRSRNPARVQEIWRAARRRWARKSRQLNKTKWIAAARDYKARRRGAEGRFRWSDIQRIYEEQKGLCFYCSGELAGKFHIDHMVPLSRGGINDPSNLCCACAFCNTSKRHRTAEEFRQWRVA